MGVWGRYVEERNRSWCSSSSPNDQRAITIGCAFDTAEPYAFRDVVYQTLIRLCIDICRWNGKNKLIWFGNKDKTLNYTPKSGEMILTVHRWFAKVSSLYIAQIKRKYGIDVGIAYNKPEQNKNHVPVCPREKELAILDALKAAFRMLTEDTEYMEAAV